MELVAPRLLGARHDCLFYLPLCISSNHFELWVPIERHWLGMHIMILSFNGALPLYNPILAYVLHELCKAQFTLLLTYCAPALVLYCMSGLALASFLH